MKYVFRILHRIESRYAAYVSTVQHTSAPCAHNRRTASLTDAKLHNTEADPVQDVDELRQRLIDSWHEA